MRLLALLSRYRARAIRSAIDVALMVLSVIAGYFAFWIFTFAHSLAAEIGRAPDAPPSFLLDVILIFSLGTAILMHRALISSAFANRLYAFAARYDRRPTDGKPPT